MRLLNLPDETLAHIFSYLNMKDILAFSATNHSLYRVYKDSIRLRYLVELESVGCIDSAWTFGGEESVIKKKPSAWDCLSYLRSRESRWEELDLAKNVVNLSVSCNFKLVLHWISAGIFLYADENSKDELRYINLREVSKRGATIAMSLEPDLSPQTGFVSWEYFKLDKELTDFGLALREHDLIVCISYDESAHREDPNSVRDIRAHFMRFSTQKSHELARQPVVNLVTSDTTNGELLSSIEVVASFVVIILASPDTEDEHYVEYLFIFNWKTGKELLKRTYTKPTFSDVVFLTQSLLLLPNLEENSFDLVHIRDPGEPIWLLRLRLPRLKRGFSLRNTYCWSDPNPEASSFDPITATCRNLNCCNDNQIDRGQKNSSPKWCAEEYEIFADPSLALMSFNLIYYDTGIYETEIHMNFVMHRSVLIDHAVKALSCMRDTIGKNGVPCSVASGPVPWEQWGPVSTRWRFEAESEELFGRTAGQRQTFVAGKALATDVLVIQDYNPYAVSRARAKAKEKDSGIYVDSKDGFLPSTFEGDIDDENDSTQSIFSDTDSDGGSSPDSDVSCDFENKNATSEEENSEPEDALYSNPDSDFKSEPDAGSPSIIQEDNEVENENLSYGQEGEQDSDMSLRATEANKRPFIPQPLKLMSIRVRDTLMQITNHCFEDGSVCCGLPCIEYIVGPPEFEYTDVVLDEERIVLLNIDEDRILKDLHVLSIYP